jgi:hypothetical protein
LEIAPRLTQKIRLARSGEGRRLKNGRRGQKDKGRKKKTKKIFYIFTPPIWLQFQNGADSKASGYNLIRFSTDSSPSSPNHGARNGNTAKLQITVDRCTDRIVKAIKEQGVRGNPKSEVLASIIRGWLWQAEEKSWRDGVCFTADNVDIPRGSS